ncbi:hypothetical protein GCM10017673_20870 [Streptosporangium violaceochromogenes]|nr:hypothetical protein GCM10017673_20870 [Streptosporangium violaceochromogenes]
MSEEHRRHGQEHVPVIVVADESVTEQGLGLHVGGNATLTPADVRNKVFTTVRLREGYDLAEVDTFLGQVEVALCRTLQENADLNARLKEAVARAPQHTAQHTARPAGDGSPRIVAPVQEAAEREIAKAREEAGRLVAEAYVRAEAVEREALDRAEVFESEVHERHRAAVDNLNATRAELSALVRDYGDRLIGCLEDQVRQMRLLILQVEGRGERPRGSHTAQAPRPPSPPGCGHSSPEGPG